jgi:ketosteroid isomerase-like protein
MSQENVEIVRRVTAAWERRDSEAVFALYDPAIVWKSGAGVIPGTYHGHEGVRQFFREWLEAFETYHAQAEAFIGAGDSVVVGYRGSARGKASGVEIGDWIFWLVYRIRNGLVTHIDTFESKAAALEAVGLSEQDAYADSS